MSPQINLNDIVIRERTHGELGCTRFRQDIRRQF